MFHTHRLCRSQPDAGWGMQAHVTPHHCDHCRYLVRYRLHGCGHNGSGRDRPYALDAGGGVLADCRCCLGIPDPVAHAVVRA